jgi:hypothetical protein
MSSAGYSESHVFLYVRPTRQHVYAVHHTTIEYPVVRFQAVVTRVNAKTLRRTLLHTTVCTEREGR